MMYTAAIRWLLGLVFLGYLTVWVLAPTYLWRNDWLRNLGMRTDSTYFGIQGANVLVHTFPIIFIAVMGCVYVHLQKGGGNYTQSTSKSHRLASWKRPVLVKGPLGVVSAMELTFISMFLALLIWSFSNFDKGIFQNSSHGFDQLGRSLRSSGLYFGILGKICVGFLFFPVTRGSSILPLIGRTPEGSIKYHIWLGHMAMAFFTAHGVFFYIYWAMTNQLAEALKWDKIGVSNVAGEIAMVLGIAMWAMALPRIRRQIFELFFYTHQLYILFLLFYILHVGITTFSAILPGIFLFLLDRYLRFLQSQQRVRLVSARLLPCEAVELNFSKALGLVYNPTSIAFISVPNISTLQWHPFTVTSNCNMEPERLSVIVKSAGSWTHKLYQTLSSPSPIDHLSVAIEGPYGPTSAHFLRHENLVMISGGSGITPFISIIRELIFRSNTLNCSIPLVRLVCAFKNYADMTMLDLLLPINNTSFDVSSLKIQIEAFVTREKEANKNKQKHIQTIWFKTNPSDAPLSAILGPKSWLWLGGVISSSFIMFLVLVGVINHYYIYPIDHNSYSVYSYSKKTLLEVLVICISIVVTASLAILWNKGRNVMEGSKIHNMDVATATASPSSWYYNAEAELECLPYQSLAENTNVYFGGRPNLRKMLQEYEGSNTGVLVAGPMPMRHEVAAICSTVDNLQFEAISFSW